jgi:hypothetical protein
MMKVFLTYDNQAKQDGIGAQLQRILAIYSISKTFRLKYHHSEILQTIEERAHNAKNQDELATLMNSVNANFRLPTQNLPKKFKEIKLYNPGLKTFLKVLIQSFFSKQTVLIKICLPFSIIEKYPDWYDQAGREVRKTPRYSESRVKNQVTVHIRYGYKPIVGTNQASTPRFLPLEYYPNALKEILRTQNLDFNFPIVVQTDIPEKNGTWKPFQEERLTELQAIGYSSHEDQFDFETIELSHYFNEFSNVTIKYCDTFIDALEEMSTSKYLLMSRSSFSYIAGILNPHNVYIPKVHNHAKLRRWFWDFPSGNEPHYELLSGI